MQFFLSFCVKEAVFCAAEQIHGAGGSQNIALLGQFDGKGRAFFSTGAHTHVGTMLPGDGGDVLGRNDEGQIVGGGDGDKYPAALCDLGHRRAVILAVHHTHDADQGLSGIQAVQRGAQGGDLSGVVGAVDDALGLLTDHLQSTGDGGRR